MIVCASAATLGDAYCSLAWGRRLATASDAATAAAVLSGAAAPALNRRESALREWVRQVATDANATTAQGVQALREAGFTDADVFDATALAAFRLAFSTVNDALGVTRDASQMRISLLVAPAACIVSAILLWLGARAAARTGRP